MIREQLIGLIAAADAEKGLQFKSRGTPTSVSSQRFPRVTRSRKMMMRKGKAKSAAAAHLAAGFILACYLAQTANCYRLKKTERRVSVADSAKTIGVREGTIVFGAVLEDESALESQVVNVTSKASVKDQTFQADSAGKDVSFNLPVFS